MKIVHSAVDLEPGDRKVCLAIGFFDGVHVGHQRIISETVADARREGALALVVTFDVHPSTIVAPQRVPPLLQTLPQRLRTIGDQGADAILLLHFDEAFSRQTGEVFVRKLAGDLRYIHSVRVGANFYFGFHRSGNVALLSQLGKELGFSVDALAPVTLDGKPVSSTRLRDSVRAGDLKLASRMLNRPYSLAGTVVRGDGLGRQLGFPTANIDTTGLVLPPGGVYLAHTRGLEPSRRAMVNIGLRPTLNDPAPQLRVEAHLIGFEGDLYGKELELEFGRKVRDEQKFPSLEALRTQIARDVEFASSAPDKEVRS